MLTVRKRLETKKMYIDAAAPFLHSCSSFFSHPFPFYKSHTLLVIPLGLHYIYITLIVNLLYSLRRSYTLSLVDCWRFLPASYIIVRDGKYEAPSGRVYYHCPRLGLNGLEHEAAQGRPPF